MRISRIQLSDHLLPAACAASQADGSLSPPFGTADSVCIGTDSSSASEPTANYVDVCVGAITATRSARPSRPYERRGCCCGPGNRYTTCQCPLKLPNHFTDRRATGKRSHHLAHPIPDMLARFLAWPHVQQPFRGFPELETQKRETLFHPLSLHSGP